LIAAATAELCFKLPLGQQQLYITKWSSLLQRPIVLQGKLRGKNKLGWHPPGTPLTPV
jgi:hypothetical protein